MVALRRLKEEWEEPDTIRPAAWTMNKWGRTATRSAAVTGEITYVDAGYNSISMPRLDVLKGQSSGADQAQE